MITDKDKKLKIELLDREYTAQEIFEMLDAKLEIFSNLVIENEKLSMGLLLINEDIRTHLNVLEYKLKSK